MNKQKSMKIVNEKIRIKIMDPTIFHGKLKTNKLITQSVKFKEMYHQIKSKKNI